MDGMKAWSSQLRQVAAGALREHGPRKGTECGAGKWYRVLPIVEQDLLEYRERMTQATYEMLFHVPRSSTKPH